MLPVKMRTENGSLLDFRETLYIMALAMKVISQVEAQRKILEEAVSTALELASGNRTVRKLPSARPPALA